MACRYILPNRTVPEFSINKNFRTISYDLIIWVPEIDLFFEEMQLSGLTIHQGIVKRSYGSREFVIEIVTGTESRWVIKKISYQLYQESRKHNPT